jgi:hypothetical protein
VVLEAPAPVRRLAHVLLAEQLQEVLDVLVADRRAHPDLVGLVGRHRERQVPVHHVEHEVLQLLAADLARLLLLDDGAPWWG